MEQGIGDRASLFCTRNRAMALLVLALVCGTAQAVTEVRVGYFQKHPIIFFAADGQVQGFGANALEAIARQQNWRLSYRQGTLAENLEWIRQGEIDLMIPVAYTERRDRFIDYPEKSLFDSWGTVYSLRGKPLRSIGDLEAKRIGHLKGSALRGHLEEIVADLGITPAYVAFDDYRALFSALAAAEIDGAISDHLAIFDAAAKWVKRIDGTLVFRAYPLFIVAAEGDPKGLLNTVSEYIRAGEADLNSSFSQYRSHWLDEVDERSEALSRTLTFLFLTVLLLFFLYALTRLPAVRNMLGLTEVAHHRISVRILFSTLLLTLFILLGGVAIHHYGFGAGESYLDALFPSDQPQQILMRTFMVSVVLLAGFVISRFISRLAVQHDISKKQEEHLRTTLDSIGDAVVVTDTRGRVVRMNPVAARLTGWSAEEARGESLHRILEIADAVSGEPRPNPVDQVIASGEINGLPGNTLLTSKDGSKYQISDSAAPIRSEEGITGVVLVFRDVTEEYRIREALRVNEERQNLALSGANEGIWDWNVVTNQAFFDSGYYTMAGYEPHEFPGSLDEWVSRMHPDDVYATVTAAKRYVAGEAEDYDVEFRFRRKDGDYMWIRARGNVVERDEQGEPIRCAGTHSDITEKKRMETQLRASQQLLSNVFETLEEGVFTLDTELRFTYLNRRMEQLIATDREQVLGVPAEQWLTAFGSGIAPMMGDALRGNATRKFHIQHGSQIGGRRKWLSLSFLPLRGSDDRITGLVSIVEDITVRREAEDQLRNLRNYLSNVIDSMPSSLIGVDVEGRVTQWNRTVESLLGISAGVALGRKLQTLLPEFDLLHERISESIESREVIHEQKVVRQQETTRYEEITIYPLMTDGIEGAVIRIDDVTEKARLEEMMVQSEKMLSVGGLAAGMAHEINNPLAGMMQTAGVMASRLGGNLQLESSRRAAEAAGTSLEAIQKFMQLRGIPRMLATITESGSRAAEIVENMLSFARKGNATTSSHQLDELVDRTLELASTDYDLKKHYDFRSITIERRYAPGLQPVPCEGSKIQQVLLNILRNGAQAMQEAEVDQPTFIVSTALDEAQGMQCISIEDNGPGMDEQTRKRVFEPFFTTKPVDAGTGLGLSVSYFIVTKNHGGLMTVDSVPGKGATFTLCLPLVQPVQ